MTAKQLLSSPEFTPLGVRKPFWFSNAFYVWKQSFMASHDRSGVSSAHHQPDSFPHPAVRHIVSFEHRCMSSAVQSSVPVRNPMQRAASACIHVSAHRTARHDVLHGRKPISQPDQSMKMSFRIFPHSPVLSVTHSLSAHSRNSEQSSILKCRSMSVPIAPHGMTFCKAKS